MSSFNVPKVRILGFIKRYKMKSRIVFFILTMYKDVNFIFVCMNIY